MSRSSQIDEAVKVTLYMPRQVSETAKVFAANQNTSLSRLVTNLLTQRMTGVVQHTIEITPEMQRTLSARAKNDGILISDLIPKIIASTLLNDV